MEKRAAERNRTVERKQRATLHSDGMLARASRVFLPAGRCGTVALGVKSVVGDCDVDMAEVLREEFCVEAREPHAVCGTPADQPSETALNSGPNKATVNARDSMDGCLQGLQLGCA
eukprot:COSAG01_NODE_5748_length_4061_cov_8.928067_2_plen_116_part_00